MPDIYPIPPRSNPECCATCARWSVHTKNTIWCLVQDGPIGALETDLTAYRCDGYVPEPRESFAIELYAELVEEATLRGAA